MSDHPLAALIRDADRAISAKNFDDLMRFYANDATLVVKPGLHAKGKEQIRRAFTAISDHFGGNLTVRQGKMEIIEGGDSALVIMETFLDTLDAEGVPMTTPRRATYVFQKSPDDQWLCTIDNSYGTALLDG